MRLPSFTLPTLLLLVTTSGGLIGCGYHAAGFATHMPQNVRVLAVPVFETRVLAYHSEMDLTQAVIHEFNIRTKYKVTPSDNDQADATLRGTILSQSVAPLTYDSQTSQTASYLITLTAKVVLTARDGRILYQNDALGYREQYQSTQDLNGFIQEDSPAVRRVAKDFAQAIVSDILESF